MEDAPLGQQPTDVPLRKETVKSAEEHLPIFTTKNLKGPCIAFAYPHFKK
jgi:hypothetical protein